MIDLSEKITALPFMAKIALAFTCGGAMILAMPPWHFWPGLFIGFSLFYILLSSVQKPLHAFGYGWAFGFGYFVIGLSWIANALLVDGNSFLWVWPFAAAGLPMALALFFASSCAIIVRSCQLTKLSGFLCFIAIIMSFEWLRGHIFTGFPWNLFGYSWSNLLPIAQLSSLGGIYWLSLITSLWAALAGFLLIYKGSLLKKSLLLTVGISTFLLSYLWGDYRLRSNEVTMRSDVTVKLIQPNIAQEDKWNSEKTPENLGKLLDLSAPESLNQHIKTLIIWPETSISDFVLENQRASKAIKDMLSAYKGEVHLLAGVLRYKTQTDQSKTYFNSLAVYNKELEPVSIYDKSHLVPFGEYIPFQKYIPLGPLVNFTGFKSGSGPKNIKISGLGAFSPLVCYEVIFPDKVVQNQEKSDLMINVTNDAWYGPSAGPYQHFVMAQFRAIEQGIPAVRSANTGISGVIDPLGRIIYQKELNQSAGDNIVLPKRLDGLTLYAKYKNLLFYISLSLIFATVIFSKLINRLDA